MHFIDKNIIFDFIRLVYFRESPGEYKNSAMIVVLANQNKIDACISEATFFSAGNYLTYKLERSGIEKPEDAAGNALKAIFKGKWHSTSLAKEEFLECLKDKRLHYEDSYQLACAKKKTKTIITRNLKDFECILEIKALAPKQFLATVKPQDLREAEKELESLEKKQ
ncbi:MAG: hypothetical protein V1493_00585 [Candidatus Diapherotrites archaeon]